MGNVLYLIFSNSPSSVVRAEIYANEYIKRGYNVEFYYDYILSLDLIYNKCSSFLVLYPLLIFIRILRKVIVILKRLLLFKKINSYDSIVVIKYITPKFLDKIRKVFSGKILYDFDDAVWLPHFLGYSNFEKVLKNVDFVSCDNEYLALKSKMFNKNTFVLNGPVPIEKFDLHSNLYNKERVVLGWIGSPSTLFYMYLIYDALEEIASKHKNVELLIIGSGYDLKLIPPFEKMKYKCISAYNESDMIRYIKSIDIGLYPLFKNELSLGRGSLKATIYMSGRVPVIASAIGGENENVIKNGENGFLAKNNEDWISALDILIHNTTLREKIAENGYQFVKSKYSVNACFDQLSNNFFNNL